MIKLKESDLLKKGCQLKAFKLKANDIKTIQNCLKEQERVLLLKNIWNNQFILKNVQLVVGLI